MKIALFSDIHANLPALHSFFNSIDTPKPDAIYCLGDLVGYHIWPNQVIAAIRRRGIATLAGNHDAKVARLSEAERTATSGKNYAYSLIGPDERTYLASLPAQFRIEFQLPQGPLTLLLVHGSPASNDEYLLQDKPEADFLNVFQKANADILCFGHSHKPYYRTLKDGDRYRHAINTGSIGKPKDGNPQGGYVLLHINADSNTTNPDSLRVEFIRFDYDVELSASALEGSPLPAEFADMLRKAY
ncbi:metallophosphoesterase family protein [Dinghuibacter silviterrae]|uniref:Putative phosphoesterase n=1 Tax=Dinghuibacter silviterrae TaxID=1539049 RepID=A0A4R8DUC2_9BACT|nr:metallophosphoesterase family protein [Dinghuibacter silviterrae]TDX01518.1 putative phosphoesterase [Dinghuibacter silviterrae]